MRYAIIALTLTTLLTACGTTPSETSSAKTREAIVPDVVSYDKADRLDAVKEIQGGQCNKLTTFMKDYKVMRDQSRAALQNN